MLDLDPFVTDLDPFGGFYSAGIDINDRARLCCKRFPDRWRVPRLSLDTN